MDESVNNKKYKIRMRNMVPNIDAKHEFEVFEIKIRQYIVNNFPKCSKLLYAT